MTTRTEHLAWCRDRALFYLDQGDVINAIHSFTFDLRNHPVPVGAHTDNRLATEGIRLMQQGDITLAREFIESFQ